MNNDKFRGLYLTQVLKTQNREKQTNNSRGFHDTRVAFYK